MSAQLHVDIRKIYYANFTLYFEECESWLWFTVKLGSGFLLILNKLCVLVKMYVTLSI